MEKETKLKVVQDIAQKQASWVQPVLVGLLMISAFLLGSLYTKVQYLEKGGAGAAAPTQGGNANPPAAQAPQEPTVGEFPKISKDDWVRGDRNAPVVLIEYSDLECPFCKKFHPTAQQISDTYKGKVAWVYRHFPLSFHVNAQKEAEASECAGQQGGNDAFWKYIDSIYERTSSNGTGFALDALVPLAKEQGLNEAKFKECLDGGKMTKKVKDQMDLGGKAGINGTPGNIVYNVKSNKSKLIPGALPFDDFKLTIDELLK